MGQESIIKSLVEIVIIVILSVLFFIFFVYKKKQSNKQKDISSVDDSENQYIEKLLELKKLYDSKLITSEDFEKSKKEILVKKESKNID